LRRAAFLRVFLCRWIPSRFEQRRRQGAKPEAKARLQGRSLPARRSTWRRLGRAPLHLPKPMPHAKAAKPPRDDGSSVSPRNTSCTAEGCKLEVPNWNLKFGRSEPPKPAVRYLPLALTPYRPALSARWIRASSRRSFFFVSSCCGRRRPVGARQRSPLRLRSGATPAALRPRSAAPARVSAQRAVHHAIPRLVGGNLLSPERRIAPRLDEMLWAPKLE